MDNDFIEIMHDAVANGVGNSRVIEFVVPSIRRELRTKDGGRAFVSGIDNFEYVFCTCVGNREKELLLASLGNSIRETSQGVVRVQDGRSGMRRPCAYVHKDTAENQRLGFHGMSGG